MSEYVNPEKTTESIVSATEHTETSEHKVLDAELYERFVKIGSFQAYEMLNGNKANREEQKQKFLNGEITNPTLDYPDLDMDVLRGIEGELASFKDDLLCNEENGGVKKAYRWRVNQKLAEVRMLEWSKICADLDGQTGDDIEEQKKHAMHMFRGYSEFVHGRPSANVFAYTVNNIREKAKPFLDSDKEDLNKAANRLNELLPVVNTEASVSKLPEEQTVAFVKKYIDEKYAHLIKIPEGAKKADAEMIKEVFEYALDAIEAEGWQAAIDEKSNRTGIGVSQEKMRIDIPASREVTAKKLAGLVLP